MQDVLERALIFDVRRHQQTMRSLREMPELDPYLLPEAQFLKSYRLNKNCAVQLVEDLRPFIPFTNRASSLSVEKKVFTTLSFLASGAYQNEIGVSAHHAIAQPTVSKCINEVVKALNNNALQQKYIKFPQNSQERALIKTGFYEKFGIPGCIGCVDGTHVAIHTPSEFEERYFNRKHYHSLNCQIICDCELNIISVDASYGGANHDSFIWNNHEVDRHLQELHAQNDPVWLLGDSGYPQRRWLMTPIVGAPENSPEAYYTDKHVVARNTVERTIGVLKARWRCLLVHRVLHYAPTKAAAIINACVVLHNICNRARLPVPELTEAQWQEEMSMQVAPNMNIEQAAVDQRIIQLNEGRAMRANLVARLWQDR